MRSTSTFTARQMSQLLAQPTVRSMGFRLAIGLLVLTCLAPILWQCITSVKLNADIAALPNIYFPQRLTLTHYTELLMRRPFWSYLGNSAIVAVSSTLLSLGLGGPAAYALARLKLPGERLILSLILIVTLFPYILLFFGLLAIVQKLGWGNHYLALIVPYTAINLPLTILVLRSFFLQLPHELEDAAKIDGYSTLSMFWQIILPMTTPALFTTGILTFIFAWNEFIFALTFITKESMKTIPVAASQIGGASVFEIPYGPIAAATVLGTIPLVLLVLLFQRRIVSGLTTGAVKG
jgi:multiple sugar transport system permease protein